MKRLRITLLMNGFRCESALRIADLDEHRRDAGTRNVTRAAVLMPLTDLGFMQAPNAELLKALFPNKASGPIDAGAPSPLTVRPLALRIANA